MSRPMGRPRVGPQGRSVRELPRVTVRAERVALDLWAAIVDTDTRPSWAVFRDMVQRYAASLPAFRRDEIDRRTRR